jgi:hypothetical protein
MSSPLPLNLQLPYWQEPKHLKSGDRVWILTDVEISKSRYMECSTPQTLFKVGIYDLKTDHVGWGIFGRDIAYALVKAGLTPPPWSAPQPVGFEIRRLAHGNGEEKGRFIVEVELIDLDPELQAIIPVAKRKFASAGLCPNSTPGISDDLLARAAKEKAIEAACLGMVGLFSAGDVKVAIGDPDADVTDVIQRLVAQGKLVCPTGSKKRWTRYAVASTKAPTIMERADWTE